MSAGFEIILPFLRPIAPFLQDPDVSEIMVNAGGRVFVEHHGLVQEATGVLMEGAPAHIDVDEVHGALAELPGVIEVHDLHVWTITSGMESISAHVVVEDRRFDCAVLGEIRSTLHERFGIHHITVQMETAAFVEHPAPC